MLSALSRRYDLVIDTEQWYRLSAVVARLCRAPLRIGFGGNERARVFSICVPYRQELYEAQSFLTLLAPLGVEHRPPRDLPFLTLPPAAAEEGERLLLPLRGRRFVALFPGASVPEKRWGTERFREVAAGVRALGYAVVVIGGSKEAAAGEEIVAGTDGVNLAGRGSLAVSAAVVARSAALITGDSGVLHLACGVGTPTVALFGPSDPVKWAPRGKGHVTLHSAASCSPCSRFGTTPSCTMQLRCLADITVEGVLAAARRVLDAHQGQERDAACEEGEQ